MVHYHGHLLYKVRATYTTHRALCSTPKWHATSDSTTHAQHVSSTPTRHATSTLSRHVSAVPLVVRCSYGHGRKTYSNSDKCHSQDTVDDK